MRAEVVAIGDELTSGQRLDTNSQWLSQQLGAIGIRVVLHTTVSDDLQGNIDVFRQAASRADVVISTGGLGPTADDLTRDALAAVLDVPLKLDEPSLAHIRQLFAHRARSMPEQNMVQAMFPEGTSPIPNRNGTAPGIAARVRGDGDHVAHVFALPGVPAEMKEMWQETVRPALVQLLPTPRLIRYRCLKCFGVGESELEAMLPDMIRRGRVPTVGITVSQATISLRIAAEGPDEGACDTLIEPTVATIRQSLGKLVFGEGEEELEHAVVRLLTERQRTLAVVEVGTAGLLSHWLAAARPSAPDAVHGAWYFGTDEAARRQAGGAASLDGERLAGALAQQVRAHYSADYGLALGPWPQQAGDGTATRVPFAVATPTNTVQRSAGTAGHPDLLQARAAKQALNLLRLQILDD